MSISEYMRKQIMEGQVNTKFEVVADVKEIKKLIVTRCSRFISDSFCGLVIGCSFLYIGSA